MIHKLALNPLGQGRYFMADRRLYAFRMKIIHQSRRLFKRGDFGCDFRRLDVAVFVATSRDTDSKPPGFICSRRVLFRSTFRKEKVPQDTSFRRGDFLHIRLNRNVHTAKCTILVRRLLSFRVHMMTLFIGGGLEVKCTLSNECFGFWIIRPAQQWLQR